MTESESENRPEPPTRPTVVCSVRESSVAAVRRELARVPSGCGLVEIRADEMSIDEIAALTRETKRPLIVTIRRRQEGGGFDGSEKERGRGLLAALEGGARFIDVEWGSPQQALAEGKHAARVILSHHGADCRLEALEPVQ